jgi:hypothetical protein
MSELDSRKEIKSEKETCIGCPAKNVKDGSREVYYGEWYNTNRRSPWLFILHQPIQLSDIPFDHKDLVFNNGLVIGWFSQRFGLYSEERSFEPY